MFANFAILSEFLGVLQNCFNETIIYVFRPKLRNLVCYMRQTLLIFRKRFMHTENKSFNNSFMNC